MIGNIFDFVFYNGDLDLINMRINFNTKFNPTLFIVTQSKFLPELSIITTQYPNIKIISDDEEIINRAHYSKLIKNNVSENYKEFSNIIFVSQNNEIPIIEKIDFESYDLTTTNLLFHKVYEYSLIHHRKYLEYGCGMLNFSHILQNPNFLGTFFGQKKKLPRFVSYVDVGITINNYNIVSEKKETYLCPYSNLEVPLIVS